MDFHFTELFSIYSIVVWCMHYCDLTRRIQENSFIRRQGTEDKLLKAIGD